MSWIDSQHRTMARWVSAMVETEVTDLPRDCSNGLVLIDLVNSANSDVASSTYTLNPTYKKPALRLQKVENVDDMLKFCRLILKINVCNISAEDIVDGDLKLILGFIWTVFVYASSRSISQDNEAKLAAEIRTILLSWVNGACRRRALPEMSNFSKDWSLQCGKRPDLVFAAIVEMYIPELVDYDRLESGRKLENLQGQIRMANDKFGIAPLAEAADFNVLAPEEKCLIFYVLQWYLFFETVNADVPGEMSLADTFEEPTESVQNDMGHFVAVVLEAVRAKNKHDTRALRLLNQLSRSSRQISSWSAFFLAVDPGLLARSIDEILAQRLTNSEAVFQDLASISEVLLQHQHYRTTVRPTHIFYDFPELQALYKKVNTELKKVGLCEYLPAKLLSVESLAGKLQKVVWEDEAFSRLVAAKIQPVLDCKLSEIELTLQKLKADLQDKSQADSSAREYVESIECLLDYRTQWTSVRETLEAKTSTADLKQILDLVENITVPKTPATPQTSLFMQFAAIVESTANKTNLTYLDVRKFMRQLVGLDEGLDVCLSAELQDFILHIPHRKLLNRSPSDDFSMMLDDSDDAVLVFDEVLRQLEHKLLGNFNNLYSLEDLVSRMEAGFRI